MIRNMGSFDRGVRAFVVAPLVVVLAFVVGAGTVAGGDPVRCRRDYAGHIGHQVLLELRLARHHHLSARHVRRVGHRRHGHA